MKHISQHQQLVGSISLWVMIAILLTGCMPIQPPTAINAQSATNPSEDITAAVNAIWTEYAASVMASDGERWIVQWTEEGVQMPPDEPFVEGKAQIAAHTNQVMALFPAKEMVITPLETRAAGDWAFSRGVYTVTFTVAATGEQGMIDGKFMTILQKQPDGSWKIHRDIFNSNVRPPAAPSPAESDIIAVTEAVNAIWDEYEASLNAGDANRWIAQWTEEGIQMPPGVPANVGKAMILTNLNAFLEQYSFVDMLITNAEVEVSGDLAYARGTYTTTYLPKDGSAPILIDGKYMTILKRQVDGSWKIHRDIFNSNVSP